MNAQKTATPCRYPWSPPMGPTVCQTCGFLEAEHDVHLAGLAVVAEIAANDLPSVTPVVPHCAAHARYVAFCPGCDCAVRGVPAAPLATDEQWNAFLTRPLPPRECTIDRNC